MEESKCEQLSKTGLLKPFIPRPPCLASPQGLPSSAFRVSSQSIRQSNLCFSRWRWRMCVIGGAAVREVYGKDAWGTSTCESLMSSGPPHIPGSLAQCVSPSILLQVTASLSTTAVVTRQTEKYTHSPLSLSYCKALI